MNSTIGSLGKNIIVGLIWLTILFLVITTQTSQMFLALLFTVFVLRFSQDIAKKYIVEHPNYQKLVSVLLSGGILAIIGFGLFISFKYMALDLNTLMVKSEPLITQTLQEWGIKDVESISQFYTLILDFVKSNVGFITASAGLILKVFIGILLGLIFHFSSLGNKSDDNLEGKVINDLGYYSDKIFLSFRNIMGIQVLVAMMNTAIIATLALGITYVWTMVVTGEGYVLPYWYVVIPLTAILSLVPVVGNILINLTLIMATIQVSPTFVLFGLGLFLVIHKLELILVGKKMKEKVDMPFAFILISMLLGELLFHSMSGMLIGMVIVLTLSNLMKKVRYAPTFKLIQDKDVTTKES